MMRGWWKDLVFGVRMQLGTPAVTTAIVATLAFGIAATSVAFSLVNSLFLRPPPIEEPARLVRIYSAYSGGLQYFTLSYPDYVDIRGLGAVFDGVVAEQPAPFSVGVRGASDRVFGELVAGGYFSVLGVRPAAGRFFTREEEETIGGEPLVVLSYGLWQRRFGGSRRVLDDPILLNGQPCRVIGIAPEGFHGVTLGLVPELWRPASRAPTENRGGRGFFAVGRLRPGVTIDQARASLEVLARQLQQEYPATNRGIRFTALSEAEGRVHPMIRGDILGFSGVLIVVAGFLLLVACANVAGILLVRATSRRREIGVRLALGATRGRIARQLLAENAILAVIAGAVGIALTRIVTGAVNAIQLPTRFPLTLDLALDARVVGFSVAIAAVAGLLFGLAPAGEGSRVDLLAMLKDAAGSRGLRTSRLRGLLVASQVALATTLLIGGGLFLRSLQRASRVDVGFDPRGVVTASVDPGLQGYSPADARQFWRRLVDELAARPAVQSVSLASTVPFELNIQRVSLGPEGYQPTPDGGWPSIDYAIVDPGYFTTMGVPLVEGRDFSERDEDGSPPVAIVNDVLARQFWPGARAVGRRVTTPTGRVCEVIGVARRTRYLTLGEDPKPYVYFPLRQSDAGAMTVILKGTGDVATLLRGIRETVRTMDETLPLYNVATMADHVGVALLPATSGAAALGLIGLVALVLTSLGLYGTVAQVVGARTREIGVRRALGAQGRDVLGLVVGQTARLVLGGLMAGGALGLAGARALAHLLYGVGAMDPVVLGLAPVVLVLVSVVACWVPAARAIRIDPASALRCE